MADGDMSEMELTLSAGPKLTLLKQIVRYAIHLIVLYEVVSFSTDLPSLMYLAAHWLIRTINPTLQQTTQFVSRILYLSA